MIALKASELFTFKKLNKNIIDLYSEEQTIILKEDKKIYDLKFKIVSYNNEKLFINYRHILENCKQVNNELICHMIKSELETILTPNKDDNFIQITYINPSSRHIICIFSLIPQEVKTFFPKKNIYVGITKLVENIAEDETYSLENKCY